MNGTPKGEVPWNRHIKTWGCNSLALPDDSHPQLKIRIDPEYSAACKGGFLYTKHYIIKEIK